jgi:hypothetical protein
MSRDTDAWARGRCAEHYATWPQVSKKVHKFLLKGLNGFSRR